MLGTMKEVKNMKRLLKQATLLLRVFKGEAIILCVENGTLVVDAGNKSAAEVQTVASTFFKKAYRL